jgi:hypothetical protein
MNKTCSQCSLEFIESSTKFYNRISKKTPILCNCCYRIAHAEVRAKVRKSHKEKQDNVRKSHIIQEGVFPYMRKHKVTLDKAKEELEILKSTVP